MKLSPGQILAIGGVGLAAAVLYFGVGGVARGLKAAGTAVNPTDRANLAYRGVNQVGDLVDDADDNGSFSLGSFLYDLTHPPYDPNAAVTRYDGGAVRGPLQ